MHESLTQFHQIFSFEIKDVKFLINSITLCFFSTDTNRHNISWPLGILKNYIIEQTVSGILIALCVFDLCLDFQFHNN